MQTLSADKILHASCVCVEGKGVLILDKSGAGKSALALALMAYGAELVADDRVALRVEDGAVIASCPPTIAGLIEARGIGILNAEYRPNVSLGLVIDLNEVSEERIQPRRLITLLGCDLPLLHGVEGIHFAPAILQFLRAGRSNR